MRVFVSHAGRDRAWAEWVGWQLEHAGLGITVELDHWDWQAGDNFIAKMSVALDTCDRMLALFSQAYFEPARWTAAEWTAAFHLAKQRPGFLVPARIDDTPTPPLLGPLIAPSLHGLPREQARDELLGAIRPLGRPHHEPLLPGQFGDHLNNGPRLPGALPSVWGQVPGRNEAFTGRDDMLVRLRQGLSGAGRSVVHALAGAGGVGKTQLAAEYTWRFAGDYDAVWWVNAEQADRIGQQFAQFAIAWGLVGPDTSVGPAVDALQAKCRSHSRWLVVLDNVTTARDIQPWRLPGPGHLLITSRDPRWPEIAATVSVDVFTRAESVALLRAHVPTQPDSDADRLADALGDLPLALAQAAGVLAETGMPTPEYLDLLDAAPADVLDEGVPISYPQSLAKSVRVAAAQLTAADPAAAQLLRLCAFLAPEPIPSRWFATANPAVLSMPLGTAVAAPLACRRLFGLLSRYGLVKLADGHLVVHRLTQLLLRADTPDPDHTAATVGRLLADLAPDSPDDPGMWSAWSELLPHITMTCLEYGQYERLFDVTKDAFRYLSWRGDIETAARFAGELRSLILKSHKPSSDISLAITIIAASLHVDKGEYAAALPMAKSGYDNHRSRLGPNDQRVLEHANLLAYALHGVKDFDAAFRLNKDIHARRSATLGPEHSDTLNSAGNLASDLIALGRLREAEAFASMTLELARTTYGEEHVQSCRAASNLACALAASGKFDSACELNRKTFAIRRVSLGDDHPHTLRSANNLAADLASLEQYEEAELIAAEVLERRRVVLTSSHPHVKEAEYNIGIIRAAAGTKSGPPELIRQRT